MLISIFLNDCKNYNMTITLCEAYHKTGKGSKEININ